MHMCDFDPLLLTAMATTKCFPAEASSSVWTTSCSGGTASRPGCPTMTYVKQTGRHQPVVDQYILEELKDQGHLGYTPARTLNGRHIVSHDD